MPFTRMACEFLKIFAVCLSSHLLSCLSSSVFMASVKVTLSSNVKRHNCGHWKINTDIRASKATCSKNLCLICLLKRTVTDSFDIQYGGWCKKKSRNRRDGCERAARACMGFCVCALFFVFFLFSLPLPAFMSLMVVAYLIIDPKATDPLN